MGRGGIEQNPTSCCTSTALLDGGRRLEHRLARPAQRDQPGAVLLLAQLDPRRRLRPQRLDRLAALAEDPPHQVPRDAHRQLRTLRCRAAAAAAAAATATAKATAVAVAASVAAATAATAVAAAAATRRLVEPHEPGRRRRRRRRERRRVSTSSAAAGLAAWLGTRWGCDGVRYQRPRMLELVAGACRNGRQRERREQSSSCWM